MPINSEKKIIVSPLSKGLRLDKFLAQEIPELSRQKIHAAIQKGEVLVDSRLCKPSHRVSAGESVVAAIRLASNELLPYSCEVKIMYEDDHILIVDKPAGLVVHPPHAGYNETLVNALIFKKKELYAEQQLRPGVVHRLDKETSGLIVLAKTQCAYKSLINQFKARTVQKEYRAICHGIINKDFLRIDLPLVRDKHNRLKMKVSMLESKNALTELTVIKRLKDVTYLSLKILTGRMHQIRVHMKFLGYPLVGDKKYGIKDNQSDLFLHAHQLGFLHPFTGSFVQFESPLPEIFSIFLKTKEENA